MQSNTDRSKAETPEARGPMFKYENPVRGDSGKQGSGNKGSGKDQTLFQEYLLRWLEVKENFASVYNHRNTDVVPKLGNSLKGWMKAAEFINKELNTSLDPEVTSVRAFLYRKCYFETASMVNRTGAGVTEGGGAVKFDEAQENRCYAFDRMDTLFRNKPHLNPLLGLNTNLGTVQRSKADDSGNKEEEWEELELELVEQKDEEEKEGEEEEDEEDEEEDEDSDEEEDEDSVDEEEDEDSEDEDEDEDEDDEDEEEEEDEDDEDEEEEEDDEDRAILAFAEKCRRAASQARVRNNVAHKASETRMHEDARLFEMWMFEEMWQHERVMEREFEREREELEFERGREDREDKRRQQRVKQAREHEIRMVKANFLVVLAQNGRSNGEIAQLLSIFDRAMGTAASPTGSATDPK
ncbi:hypothetical protein BGZ58_007668 [Dissophora ornata]|nr:hypothetical protein BGZ58_007668 [Dissophora ornata]